MFAYLKRAMMRTVVHADPAKASVARGSRPSKEKSPFGTKNRTGRFFFIFHYCLISLPPRKQSDTILLASVEPFVTIFNLCNAIDACRRFVQKTQLVSHLQNTWPMKVI